MKRVNESYNQRKDEILRLYKEYLPFKEQYGDNIDSASLDNMCTNIKNGKFLLLVAGEAKSGKSTFINAFLGNKILPMDVKQCTSALIEITHDENVTLSAEYADGRKITKNGEDDVRKFLLEHAALSDNYRNIPITSINNDILIKSKGNIRKDEVDDLINKCKGDNIYGLSDEEYKKLINDYIEEYKDKWCDIVTKITITYPLTEGMQDITMIDSPGVNAAGKVGDITNQYIGKADAIIFVKSLTGHAVESSSFRDFLNSNAINLSKAARLLVFTRKSDLEEKEVNTIKEQAEKMYHRYLTSQRITAIDSKIQLFYYEYLNKNEDELNSILEKIEFKPVGYCWFKSGKHRKEFLDLLKKESNFDQVIDMLDKFAAKAHYIQLLEFLNLLNCGYETLTKKIEERLLLLRDTDDPAKLKKKIAEKQAEIDEIELKMHEGIRRIIIEYNDHNSGLIKQEAEKAFQDFRDEFSKTKGVDNVEKKTLEGQNLFSEYQKNIRKRVISSCDKELIEISNKTSIPAQTIIPIITEEEFVKVKEETKNNAKKNEYYETGACWWKETHTRSVYSMEKHIELIQKKILEYLENTKGIMLSSLYSDVVTITKIYREKLEETIDIKSGEYQKLCSDFDTAEKMIKQATKLEEALTTIIPIFEKVKSIKGAIEDVVK